MAPNTKRLLYRGKDYHITRNYKLKCETTYCNYCTYVNLYVMMEIKIESK